MKKKSNFFLDIYTQENKERFNKLFRFLIFNDNTRVLISI